MMPMMRIWAGRNEIHFTNTLLYIVHAYMLIYNIIDLIQQTNYFKKHIY